MGSTPRPGDAAAAVPGPRPGAGMRAAPAAGGSRRKVTPAEFKGLLPCGGAVPHIYGKHDRKFFKVEYACASTEKPSISFASF